VKLAQLAQRLHILNSARKSNDRPSTTAGLSDDDRNNFDRAIKLLSSLWGDVKASEIAASHIVTALNLITALRFAARTDDAAKVVKAHWSQR
jgi:hypothetical protein